MKKKLKWVLVSLILLVLILVISIGIITSNESKTNEVKEEELIFKEEKDNQEEKKDQPLEEEAKVFVDIKGAVLSPGVYEIEKDKKIIDVVSLAGGLLEEANTTTINLAKKVQNEMVIIVYTNEEINKAMRDGQAINKIDNTCVCPKIKNDVCINNNTKNEENNESNNTTSIQEIININTATASDFDKLPGIGASKAEAIIQYREEHGSFSKIEDLKEISGIGDALFEKIKDYITV